MAIQKQPFFNLPNILTLIRIALIPCFIVVFYWKFSGHYYIAALFFLLASMTDWLDGYLARTLKQTSAFGAFLDPVADKLMIAAALVLLVANYQSAWVTIPGIIIVAREIVISALREWMAELGQRAIVKVSTIGKIKTATQMFAILILLSQPAQFSVVTVAGVFLLYVAVLLTLWSMQRYLSAAYRVLS